MYTTLHINPDHSRGFYPLLHVGILQIGIPECRDGQPLLGVSPLGMVVVELLRQKRPFGCAMSGTNLECHKVREFA